MIQETLRNKYHDCLTGWTLTDKGKKIPAGLDIYENKSSIVVPKIVIKEECKGNGVGTQIMNDLIAATFEFYFRFIRKPTPNVVVGRPASMAGDTPASN